jgi:phosphomannomutase
MSLLERAKAWLAQDPDPVTRKQLQSIIDSGDETELQKSFEPRIAFGTAGLRGELGAGATRMNRVVVAQTARGLADYLLEREPEPSVVIGYDGRVNSDVFAEDSAQILAGAGIRVTLFDRYVPTPVVAHSVKFGNFSAGIMVTASHNPPNDNGYKVYLGGDFGGSQIISPIDRDIEAKILAVAESLTFNDLPKSEDFELGGENFREAYYKSTLKLTASHYFHNRLKVVYTAMHGVGLETLNELLRRAGASIPIPVTEQVQPDGSFPTTSFPNPEEPGAMDLAFAKARAVGADLIIATDPDADRLAIGIPSAGGFSRLSGDEVGLLLAHELGTRARTKGTFANSIVSSSALKRVAEQNGLAYEQTLTGFKWIMRVENLSFGYEEALGYAIDPSHTPDKDGISAALMVLAIADRLHHSGTKLSDYLMQLKQRYGYRPTAQVSVRVENQAEVAEILSRLIQSPPTSLQGQAIRVENLSKPLGDLPPTDGLKLYLANGDWVILRPSGTEPKFKAYLETSEDNLEALKAEVRKLLV